MDTSISKPSRRSAQAWDAHRVTREDVTVAIEQVHQDRLDGVTAKMRLQSIDWKGAPVSTGDDLVVALATYRRDWRLEQASMPKITLRRGVTMITEIASFLDRLAPRPAPLNIRPGGASVRDRAASASYRDYLLACSRGVQP